MSCDASEAARNCASHYEARQQYLRDSEDEFDRRQRDWKHINQLERALDASTRRVDELCRENERLRELVRDMYKALFNLNLDHCQACPREDACVLLMHKSFDCRECSFERDMRELGVEP